MGIVVERKSRKNRKFKNPDDVKNELMRIHKNRYRYHFDTFRRVKNKIKITCDDHGDFYQSIEKHLSGQGCPKCKYIVIGNKKRTPIDGLFEKFINIHKDLYNYDNSIYHGMMALMEVKCNRCGRIFKVMPYRHLKGDGCRICGYKTNGFKRRHNLEKFIEKARKIHDDMYEYYEYTLGDQKVKIKCKKCNNIFYQTPEGHLNKKGCPFCNFSKGELLINKLLIKNNIKFIRQFKLPGYKFRYDFYLPNYNLLIEFHGRQHYEPVRAFGGKNAFDMVRTRDAFKRSLAKEYKMNMLEIKFSFLKLPEDKFENMLINSINKRMKYGTSY